MDRAAGSLFDLAGRRAVVTGGGSGIGLAMARALNAHGADVCLWGRDRARLDAAASQLEGPGRATVRRVDVTDEDAVAEGMAAVVAELGGLEVVIANAGTNAATGPFLDCTTADYRATMSTNLDGAWFTVREGSRAMVDQRSAGTVVGAGGSIIVVASLAALLGAGCNQAYAASKAAAVAMANGVAIEVARHDIRVNSVLPGWTATEMSRANQDSQAFTDKVISRVPQRRWGQPEDFAGVAVYLASDASRFQTASTMVIDGGYSMF